MSKSNRRVERAPMTEDEIRSATVGELERLSGPTQIVDYDPRWPELFQREAGRILEALGEPALLVEHVGSTAVPGLAAKPRIDIVLVVADSANESAYLPALAAAGYTLRVREPHWYQHRMLRGADTDINLHVFSAGCPEVDRMLCFRDWLRSNAADRRLYERTKRALAQRDWTYTQNYADAKTAVVEEILSRARRYDTRCTSEG